MSTVKIIRFVSGEDVIATYTNINGVIFLENPMSLMFKQSQSGIMMLMYPWIPFEVIQNHTVSVQESKVLTLFDPRDNLIQYYNNIVSEEETTRDENADRFMQSLLEDTNGEEMLEESDDSNGIEEESTKVSKTTVVTLH